MRTFRSSPVPCPQKQADTLVTVLAQREHRQTVDFCRPPEVAILQRVLGRMSDLKIVSEGGYPQVHHSLLSQSLAQFSPPKR